jgi:predicted secreted protein
MATLTGNDGQVVVGGTTVAATRNFSIEITSDTIETSAMSNDSRVYVSGMSSFSGSADIYFDPSEFDGAESTFNATSGTVGAAPVAVKLYVKQDATNDQVFTGNVIVTGYTVNSAFDGMVEASISFQGSGAATFSASGNV